MVEFGKLLEECIAGILSRTTPIDACRLSAISKTFLSASNSDAVWNHFLRSDSNLMESVISRFPSLANTPTEKALFCALPDRAIIIDNGKKSFQLVKKSGKICYMLSARSLTIACGHGEKKWFTKLISRFPEVAELRSVSWFHIHGIINMHALSPNTQYATYLVFKMIDAQGAIQDYPVELSIGVRGGHSSPKIVYLDSDVELPRPIVRIDGWLEIEIGEFFNSGLEHEKVEMNIKKTSDVNSNVGLFLEGIEVRPK